MSEPTQSDASTSETVARSAMLLTEDEWFMLAAILQTWLNDNPKAGQFPRMLAARIVAASGV